MRQITSTSKSISVQMRIALNSANRRQARRSRRRDLADKASLEKKIRRLERNKEKEIADATEEAWLQARHSDQRYSKLQARYGRLIGGLGIREVWGGGIEFDLAKIVGALTEEQKFVVQGLIAGSDPA